MANSTIDIPFRAAANAAEIDVCSVLVLKGVVGADEVAQSAFCEWNDSCHC
jgi:hypothetical protein